MPTPFCIHEDVDTYTLDRPVSADEIIEQAKAILVTELKAPSAEFPTPTASRDFFRLALAKEEREVFACIFLDNRHRMIHYQEMFLGTIDGASVHPREVVKAALKHNAAAVIFGHNHPSGHPEPSEADRRITSRLKEALALVDIRVLDHLVVGLPEPVSLAERGLL